jgi:hypothetical protein
MMSNESAFNFTVININGYIVLQHLHISLRVLPFYLDFLDE